MLFFIISKIEIFLRKILYRVLKWSLVIWVLVGKILATHLMFEVFFFTESFGSLYISRHLLFHYVTQLAFVFILFFYPFHFYEISNDSPHSLPDHGNLSHLFSLAKALSILFTFTKNFSSLLYWFSLLFVQLFVVYLHFNL